MKKHYTLRRTLRAARIMRGLDQVQLARAVRLKQPDISYFETGRSLPTHEQAQRICEVLGADPQVLFPELFSQEHREGSRG